jgi:hypothetical protein
MRRERRLIKRAALAIAGVSVAGAGAAMSGRSIIVAVVGTIVISSAAHAQDMAAKRVAPEIGSGSYNNITADERRHGAHLRRGPLQEPIDNLAAKRIAPEIGSAGFNIATDERHHGAYRHRRR